MHFADEVAPGLGPSLAEMPSETMQQLQHNLQVVGERVIDVRQWGRG